MRRSERKFLKHVSNELVSLNKIADSAGLTYQQADWFATYLEEQGLVRTSIVQVYGEPVRLICKPIDKRSWKEKYWWLLSLLSFIGGIVATVIADLITDK